MRIRNHCHLGSNCLLAACLFNILGCLDTCCPRRWLFSCGCYEVVVATSVQSHQHRGRKRKLGTTWILGKGRSHKNCPYFLNCKGDKSWSFVGLFSVGKIDFHGRKSKLTTAVQMRSNQFASVSVALRFSNFLLWWGICFFDDPEWTHTHTGVDLNYFRKSSYYQNYLQSSSLLEMIVPWFRQCLIASHWPNEFPTPSVHQVKLWVPVAQLTGCGACKWKPQSGWPKT